MVSDDVLTRVHHEHSTLDICRFVAVGGMSLFAAQSGITLASLLLSTTAAPWLGHAALMAAELAAALTGLMGLISRWRALMLVGVWGLTLDPLRAMALGGPFGWTALRGHLSVTGLVFSLLPCLGTVCAAWWLLSRGRWQPAQASPSQTWPTQTRVLGVLMPLWLALGPVLTISAFRLFDLDMSTGIALASITALIYVLVLAYPGTSARVTRWEWSVGSVLLLSLFLPHDIADFLDNYDDPDATPSVILFAVEVLLALLVVLVSVATRNRTPRARHATR